MSTPPSRIGEPGLSPPTSLNAARNCTLRFQSCSVSPIMNVVIPARISPTSTKTPTLSDLDMNPLALRRRQERAHVLALRRPPFDEIADVGVARPLELRLRIEGQDLPSSEHRDAVRHRERRPH